MPTILVADDDPLHRELLAILLRSAGHDAILATDGADLVALATDAPPALILTDLAMPHIDGLAAIRHLRADARTAPLPILAMSARADLADDALAAGATAFLLKPFSLDALLAQVASLVAANDATVLALSPDEASIARDLAAIVNASSPALHHALAALADTLVTIDQHRTDGDAADALIAAAEAVLDAAALTIPAHA